MSVSKWIDAHDTLIGWGVVLSVVAFVATLVIVPLLVIRIPSDYFTREGRRRRNRVNGHPALLWLARIAKNTVGAVLVVAGIVMLVLPGQGVLTMLLGLMLIDFPGKLALERWLITRPSVLAVITRLRHKAGRPPLEFDAADG